MNFLALLVQMAGAEQSKAQLMLLQFPLRPYLIIFGQAAHAWEHFSGRDFDAIFPTMNSPSGSIAICHAAGLMAWLRRHFAQGSTPSSGHRSHSLPIIIVSPCIVGQLGPVCVSSRHLCDCG